MDPKKKCRKPCCVAWFHASETVFRTACGHCKWIYFEWDSVDPEGDARRAQLSQAAYRDQHEESGCPDMRKRRERALEGLWRR